MHGLKKKGGEKGKQVKIKITLRIQITCNTQAVRELSMGDEHTGV